MTNFGRSNNPSIQIPYLNNIECRDVVVKYDEDGLLHIIFNDETIFLIEGVETLMVAMDNEQADVIEGMDVDKIAWNFRSDNDHIYAD